MGLSALFFAAAGFRGADLFPLLLRGAGRLLVAGMPFVAIYRSFETIVAISVIMLVICFFFFLFLFPRGVSRTAFVCYGLYPLLVICRFLFLFQLSFIILIIAGPFNPLFVLPSRKPPFTAFGRASF